MFTGFALTALFAVVFFGGWRWQQAAVAGARLSALFEKKDEVSRLDGALRDDHAHTPPAGADAADTRTQLIDVQKQLQTLDEDIGNQSIEVAKANAGTGNESDALTVQGDRFFAAGRVSEA